MTHNHDDYEERLQFARQMLGDRFKDIGEIAVEPLDSDPENPFKYNNFVYRINLSLPLSQANIAKNGTTLPGCSEIPTGTKHFILRIANSRAENMHANNRMENEVAMISLAAAAVQGANLRPIVPKIYGWGTVAKGSPFGWILQELMPGITLDELLQSAVDEKSKRKIFSQMAEILNSFHKFQLPDTIKGFGGVTFNDEGDVISSQMPTVGDGPWSSYEESFAARLRVAIRKADQNKYIQGWRSNKVRDRLDQFVQKGVAAQFEGAVSKPEKCIIHADFTPTNILVDPSECIITGLIDYDFSCILHPSYEYFRSFSGGLGEQFRGWHAEETGEDARLRHSKLHGFPSPLPAVTENGVNWIHAKLWEDELERLDVQRPRTMAGIEGPANVNEVLGTILPWRLSNSDILRLQSEEVILKCRAENEAKLQALLQHLGY